MQGRASNRVLKAELGCMKGQTRGIARIGLQFRARFAVVDFFAANRMAPFFCLTWIYDLQLKD